MPHIKITVQCVLCLKQITPFLCKGGVHAGQWAARCYNNDIHPDVPYWYFWPPGTAPHGLPAGPVLTDGPQVTPDPALGQSLHPPPPAPVPVTVTQGVCAFPGCTKKTPTSTSRCTRAMCKTHCINAGGCTTGIKHQAVHAGCRQQKQKDPMVGQPLFTITEDVPGPSSASNKSGDVQYEEDLETARRLSLATTATAGPFSWKTGDDSHSFIEDMQIDPAILALPEHVPLARDKDRRMEPPGSEPPSSPLLAPKSRPILIAAITHRNPLPSTQKGKGKAHPKIMTQMNETWAAKYKIGSLQLSAKAQKDKDRLAAELASKRCIDLVFWNQDRSPLKIMALQATGNDESDIPNWPDFALTDVASLLPSLGEQVIAVEWFNPTHLLWKTITRLSFSFQVKHNDYLFLRHAGVTHCEDFNRTLYQFSSPPKQPHLFQKKTEERKAVLRNLVRAKSCVSDLSSSLSDVDSDVAIIPPPLSSSRSNDFSHTKRPRLDEDTQELEYRPSVCKRITEHHPSTNTASQTSSMSSESPCASTAPSTPPAPCPQPLLLPKSTKCSEKWPNNEYVVDVIAGIEAMDKVDIQHLPISQCFQLTFQRPFIRTTFNDARQRWSKASPTLRNALLEAGRTPPGRWDILTRAVKLKQNSMAASSEPDIDLTLGDDE